MADNSKYIFRQIVISWRGEQYKFTPSMNLLRTIERDNISFIEIHMKARTGRAPLFDIAHVLSKFLLSTGVNVPSLEIYGEIINGGDESAKSLIAVVLEAATPIVDTSKNPDAQTENP